MIKLLSKLHRWVSIGLCLMFAIWFASGVVMIYVPFPSLPDAERIARAEIVDISGITSLSDALTATDIQSVDRLRLLQYQERPTLIVEGQHNNVVAIFADSTELIQPLTDTAASHIAEKFLNASVA